MQFDRLSRMSSKKASTSPGTPQDIKTLAIFDLETTGLNDPIKITELTIVAVSVKHFLSSEALRIKHKLTVCFEPEKELETGAVEITGLNNQLLQEESKFDSNAASLITNFIKKLQQPVCLIAHNGDFFDFPVLENHFDLIDAQLPQNLYHCDSLSFFRWADPTESGIKKSYAQTEIYKRLFNKDPDTSHEAESDVINLLQCVLKHKEQFVWYVNENCEKFE